MMVSSIPGFFRLFLLLSAATASAAATLELLSFDETPPEALSDPSRPAGGGARTNGLEWFLFANHCHTRASHDSSTPLPALLAQAALHGAASINITDHRTLDACNYPSFEPSFGVIPICGEEWGSDGHAGLLNMPPDADPMDGWEISDMVPEARALGATVIANHPFFSGDPWPEQRISAGIEGIEVWNSIWWWPQSGDWRANQRAIRWWQEHLVEGRRVFGIGGSDVHYVGLQPLRPCNYVFAATPEPDDVQAAVAGGRIGISEDENAPRAFLWVSVDGGEELPIGTNLVVTEPTGLRFRIAIKQGKGDELYLYTREGLVHSARVDRKRWELVVAARADAGSHDFLRVELRAAAGARMRSLTNPIYVNYTG